MAQIRRDCAATRRDQRGFAIAVSAEADIAGGPRRGQNRKSSAAALVIPDAFATPALIQPDGLVLPDVEHGMK